MKSCLSPSFQQLSFISELAVIVKVCDCRNLYGVSLQRKLDYKFTHT